MKNSVREDFTTYKVAKLMKDKGCRNYSPYYYNVGITDTAVRKKLCTGTVEDIMGKDWNQYDDKVACYTLNVAAKWIKANYGIFIEVFMDDNGRFAYLCSEIIDDGRVDFPIGWKFDVPEEAMAAGIMYVLSERVE